MKRKIAWLLAFCLVAAWILPVRAADPNGASVQKERQNEGGTLYVPPEGDAAGAKAVPGPTDAVNGTIPDNGNVPGAAPDAKPDNAGSTPGGGTIGGTENTPGEGTTNGTENAPGGGTITGTENAPGGGTTNGTENMPGGGTITGTENMPGGGTITGTENTPGEGTITGTENTPGDGTTNGTENTPGGGTTNGTGTTPGTAPDNTVPGDTAAPGDTGMPGVGGIPDNKTPDGIIPDGTIKDDTTPDGTEVPGTEIPGTETPVSSADDEEWNKEYAPSDAKGRAEVILRNVLPIDASQKIALTVRLESGDGNVIAEKEEDLGREADAHTILFDGLLPGTYRLKVEERGGAGFGFLPYEQDIVVDGDIRTAEIHTGFVNLDGFDYKEGSPHPGVLLIGDANRDGRIDEADRNAIMEAISRGENGVLAGDPNVELTDLDKDGKTDLVDLQYYVNSRAKLNENADTRAVLAGNIAPEAVKVNIDTGNTKVTGGDPSALLSDASVPVVLETVQGGAITEQNPVKIGFNLQSKEKAERGEYAHVEQILISMGQNAVESGELLLETDGEPISIEIANGIQAMEAARSVQEGRSEGLLKIDLGGQIAVKKVTFRITGTTNGGSLAEISKVEFLNDMEKRISEPSFNIPQILSATGGNRSFTLTWEAQTNITGYEVEIRYGGEVETVRVASNSLEVKSFRNGKLTNGETYEARVRSVNGTWAGPYGEWASVVPEASSRPDAPDNLKAVGGYCCIRMSWKDMKDTDSYQVYYKELGESSFQTITGIEKNQYTITGLKDQTGYEVYVTGVNALGESGPSLHSEVWTITLKPAQMPKYKLINESNGEGKVSAHIVSATHGRGEMITSALDKDSQSALGTVDKNFGSYYQILDWDDGAEYVANNKGILFTLDDYYEMSYIAFAEPEDIASYAKVSVCYFDEEHPNGTYAENVSVVQRTDANGRKYYMVKLAEPIRTNKIKLGFARGYALYNMTIAEVNFYYYDSLEHDILGLYGDDLHTVLKEGVTEGTIDELQKRLDTKDEKSGEYHPERAMLQRELENARGLLSSEFRDIVTINPAITAAKDGHLGFGGLNAWQPLGISAYEGEELVIYVGHDRLKTGSNSALKLIATQYHAEAGAFASEVATLKVGRNEITIPSIQSLACEGGGALYIQYTGNNANDRYAVRVSGGGKVPVLNLYGVKDEQSRKDRIVSYVKELEEHVASMEEQHKQIHETAGAGNKVNRAYDKQNCILGATDIVLDQMMLSVSAEQILAGLGQGTTEQRADKLGQSLRAMDEMMHLFYQHKGLSADASAPATDRMPAQHLNIRYMRMFAGAFMYASGNHIGIEWGSVPGLASSVPVQTDENGKYASGRYFGWGIGHEIGHNINQGSYAIAEVTNNYFAQLIKSEDSNATVRFNYENVYKKVTSNTVGSPGNVFTHLAMYWQLHLAYDRGYNYKTYDSYEEQQANLFYARVDSYSRDASRAKGGLRLDGGSEQNIMRLACAAAEKDLTEFFMRWGLVPDAETMRYASQFGKEERAIYYLTDDARVYEIEHGISGSVKGQDVIAAGSMAQIGGNPNEVVISIQSTADPGVILGYEIARYSYEDGKPVRQVVGFSTENTYTDRVAIINNRVLTYEVTAVDKFGFRSNAYTVGNVRISHDGSHDKSQWTVTTNMGSELDGADGATEEDPCAPETVSAIYRVIDGNYEDTYAGQTSGSDAVILLRMNQPLAVCGLKYTVKSGTPVSDYEIEVSVDGSQWTTVKKGRFEEKKGSQTVYFENAAGDPWICTYDAAYVRLKALGQSHMSITEVDLLGPAGDSISFGVKESGTQGAVGILEEEYVYEQGKAIPQGSLIFTGNYKGNPDYNVVVLYDEDGSVVGGVDEENVLKAEQIILAKVPENGALGEVSDGIWIYWIEPEYIDQWKGKTVRAQLYRVDNAMTNEGQRLVSDTLPLRIPETLEYITFVGKEEQ